MIYKRELMVGNIVSALGVTGQIESINEDYCSFAFGIDKNGWCGYDEMFPLLINDNSVMMLGFEEMNTSTMFLPKYRLDNVIITKRDINQRSSIFVVSIKTHIEILSPITTANSIHELQNIYFAITGKKI